MINMQDIIHKSDTGLSTDVLEAALAEIPEGIWKTS